MLASASFNDRLSLSTAIQHKVVQEDLHNFSVRGVELTPTFWFALVMNVYRGLCCRVLR